MNARSAAPPEERGARYLFRDTDIAARRLELLAEVFAPSSRAFLQDADVGAPRLALDLGCGPGHSTHRLAESLPDTRLVGLDSSAHFIALARETETERISFSYHDVTSVPFPAGPADLIHCRFLITHLREPEEVVTKWATQLRPARLLLMEETEWIETNSAVFRAYIEIVQAMLEHNANQLYAGRALERLGDAERLKRTMSRVGRLHARSDHAAQLFFMNIQSWKVNSFIRASYPPAILDALEEDLRRMSIEREPGIEIEWGLRQIVYRRA